MWLVLWKGGLPVERDVLEHANTAIHRYQMAKAGQLYLPEIFFFSPTHGIPAIYKYLVNEGFTNIEMSITSVPYATKQEYL